jgi:uncharacterized DUF497 family protein
MNFEWDPRKDRINRKIHGISFSAAKFVFNDMERWERFDSAHSEQERRMKTSGGYIMVKETLKAGQKPTKAQIKEIRAAEKRPITYTDDAPCLTVEELAEFKQINAENRKKIPCTLRISKKSLDWWKSLGEGYTAVMARMLEDAQNHPDILRKII